MTGNIVIAIPVIFIGVIVVVIVNVIVIVIVIGILSRWHLHLSTRPQVLTITEAVFIIDFGDQLIDNCFSLIMIE